VGQGRKTIYLQTKELVMPPIAATVAAGLVPTALVAGTIGAPIASSVMAMTQDKPESPQMPEIPKVEDAQAQAKKRQIQRRADIARSQSVFTSPLGIGGEAEVARKTLLGQ
jgi:sugar phosphate permease